MSFLCPCCGSNTGKLDPIYAVSVLGLQGDRGHFATFLAKNYGKWVTSTRLAGYVFSHRPDGGPLNPLIRVRVMSQQLIPYFASVGMFLEIRNQVGYRLTHINNLVPDQMPKLKIVS
jgi:hypothetical protein